MAIYTKHGQLILGIRVDQTCYAYGELLKVWARLESAGSEKQLFISDLRGDREKEVADVIRATVKGR